MSEIVEAASGWLAHHKLTYYEKAYTLRWVTIFF